MKKIIFVTALLAFSSYASAFDYKFNLEGRADFVSGKTKSTANSGAISENKSNGFETGVIRLNMFGNINEQLSYRMRYRFNEEGTGSAATLNTKDKSTSDLDLFYVDHKNSLFIARFGKSNWAEAFGRESSVSSTDLFLKSDARTAYVDNVGEYRFGASAIIPFLESHKLTLALSNPNATVTDITGNKKNTSLAYAIHYSSILFSKAFQPLLSYTVAKQDGDVEAATTSANYKMMAAGFRSEAASNLIVDLDWKQFNKEKMTVAPVAANGKTSSIFAKVVYTLDEVSPFIEYVNDKFKNESATLNADYKKNSFAGGVMWKPFNDLNFRYHLLYTTINKKFDSASAATTKFTDNRITFGIKADI